MKKEKKNLTIATILSLDAEINGGESFKPIVNENLNIQVKYWLGKFGKLLSKEVEEFNSARNELVKKYAEGEKAIIPFQIKDPNFEANGSEEEAPMIPNPNFEKFKNDVLELLKVEVELEVPMFSIGDFDFKTELVYRNIEENLITD